MLEVSHVEMRFGQKEVLRGVTLTLHQGVYGLLGPNGSGKTTLMRCIAGVYRPAAGIIRTPERIGYLPQRFGMFKQLTVYEAMAYFAALKQIPARTQRKAIMECLEQVHLADRADDRIGALSGGMVRRVGIAQALLGCPELILADEPTAGLDPEERLRFKNVISNLRGGPTVVLSTHIVEDVESTCDHIILLYSGKVLAESTADDLRAQAAGKVFSVPADKRCQLQQPYHLLREEAGTGTLRVLSDLPQPGDLAAPTVEDGYMLYIRGRM